MSSPSQPSDPADLDVVDAARSLADRSLSATELVEACLARIDARNGTHSHNGDPESVNAWVRVYADDARADAARADDRLSARSVADLGPAPALCGIPVGLEDLYGVAGKPLTASSRLLAQVPELDSALWDRLRTAGMILLGHLHTHEFGAGATTDQVANPWDPLHSAGGSAGGAAAALAARMVPAAAGSDTFGSLRIPSALCGISAFKPTRGVVPLDGAVPLCPTLDHAGPMARTVADCALLFGAMAGTLDAGAATALPLAGRRIGRSPQAATVALDPDVADGYFGAIDRCIELGASVVDVDEAPPTDVLGDFFNVFGAEILPFHGRFESFRGLYRPSVRGLIEQSERTPLTAHAMAAAQTRRRHTEATWMEWFAQHNVFALIEPTVPVVAPTRGAGYEQFGTQLRLGALSHYWNWTGFPVVSLPAGVGGRSGLPVGVSLIGPARCDNEILGAGMALQAALGVPRPPGL